MKTQKTYGEKVIKLVYKDINKIFNECTKTSEDTIAFWGAIKSYDNYLKQQQKNGLPIQEPTTLLVINNPSNKTTRRQETK